MLKRITRACEILPFHALDKTGRRLTYEHCTAGDHVIIGFESIQYRARNAVHQVIGPISGREHDTGGASVSEYGIRLLHGADYGDIGISQCHAQVVGRIIGAKWIEQIVGVVHEPGKTPVAFGNVGIARMPGIMVFPAGMVDVPYLVGGIL